MTLCDSVLKVIRHFTEIMENIIELCQRGNRSDVSLGRCIVSQAMLEVQCTLIRCANSINEDTNTFMLH